jgi:hypothetical protein
MIKKVLQEIRDNQEILKKELVIDQRTLEAQMGNRRRAEENVKSLFSAPGGLRDAVRKNCVVMLVTGKNAQQFSDIAANNYGCFSYDARGVIKDLASKVDDQLLNRVCTSDIFNIVFGAFGNLAHELGFLGYNFLHFKAEDAVTLRTREDLVNVLTKAFCREVGGEMIVYKAIHDASVSIMESDFEGSKVPIILYSENKELIDILAKDGIFATPNVFVIEASKKQTEETVEKKLIEIKNLTKGE